MPQSLRLRLVPVLVMAAVALLPVVQHDWKLHSAQNSGRAAALASSQRPAAMVSGTPNRIVVPAAGIDLSVVKGSIAPNGLWTVAATQANYAGTTANPSTHEGRPLIYGHATSQVFGPLLDLKAGAIAYVYTQNGHLFTYRYTGESHDVVPSDTSIFKELSRGTGLVLMTCDGQWYQYRHLMSFDLEKAI